MSFTRRPPVLPQGPRRARGRPKLWVEGSQKPPFKVGAFARVSLGFSRQAASPALVWSARATDICADRMARNRLGPRLAAMGRLGRALPSRMRIAAGLSGLARLLQASAEVAVPRPPDPAPPFGQPAVGQGQIARRAIPRLPELAPAVVLSEPRPPEPVHVPPVPADADFDAPTLAAIRAMIAEVQNPVAIAPRRVALQLPDPPPPPSRSSLLITTVPLTPQEPRDPTIGQRLTAQMFHGVAVMLAWTVTALALPVGAGRALLAHLNGEDLRANS